MLRLPTALIFLLAASGAVHAVDSLAHPRNTQFIAGQALTLQLSLDSTSFMNGGYAIDSAGFAELPLAGRLHVSGRTPKELEEFLVARLSNYLKDINIKATPAIRLTLLGHFVNQGQYYVSPTTTVWEAVRIAGGMAGEQNIFKIHVLRGTRPVEVSVLDEYSRGRTLEAAGIRSGDIIVFPVPRPNEGFWYWFRESLSVTAQIASVATGILSLYVTYLLLDSENLNRP